VNGFVHKQFIRFSHSLTLSNQHLLFNNSRSVLLRWISVQDDMLQGGQCLLTSINITNPIHVLLICPPVRQHFLKQERSESCTVIGMAGIPW